MQIFPSTKFFEKKETVILRHVRENLNKCSLKGLEDRPDFLFLTYPLESLPLFDNMLLLTVDAPPLSEEDREKKLFFIDATWRLASKMEKFVDKQAKFEKRSLPSHFRTAYPRRQTGCSDPERGLATLEAIYIAFLLTGRSVEGLLDNYYWKDSFLAAIPTDCPILGASERHLSCRAPRP